MSITMKAARVNAGLTQEQLASKLDISRQSVMDYENGRREVPTIYLIAFCQVIGLDLDDIFLPESSQKANKTK